MHRTEARGTAPSAAEARDGRWGDRGAATIEQLGVVVVVALLAIASVAGVATYGPHLSAALCRVADAVGMGGGCDTVQQPVADVPRTDEDYRPPVCTLQTDSDQASSKVTIGFISFGEDSGFVVTQNSDGTVTATVTNGGSLGAEGGFGASIGTGSKGDLGLGADVSFGGGLTFGAGDTWTFKDMNEWESMREQLDDYLIQQMSLRNDTGGGYALYLTLSNNWVDPPRAPEVTTASFGVEGSVDFQAGLRLGTGDKSKSGNAITENLNRGIYAQGELSGTYIQTTNSVTGETSNTYQFEASGGGGLNWGFANAGGGGEYQQAYKVTRDRDGEITGVEFMQETSASWSAELDLDSSIVPAGQGGNGSVSIGATEENQRTVVTTALAVDDSNRGTVEDWLSTNAALAGEGAVVLPSNAFNPDKPVPDDAFANLLYEQGTNAVQVYDNVEDGFSFGAEFAVGLKVGASFSSSSSTSTINSAIFLGAPGADGTRTHVDDALCSLG